MSFTAEQFEALVHRCEAEAAADRTRYARHVTLLALVGYGYVWLVLATLVGAVALLVAWAVRSPSATYRILALAAPLVFMASLVFHALRVPFRRPSGVRVRRVDAPALHALVERLTRELRSAHVHGIVLTEACNAAVDQVPRLGPLGLYRNYVVVGLPIMLALSPPEFDAIVAHELGHLSRRHGRRGAWLYRTRATWNRLALMVEAQGPWGRRLFAWFLDRWAPWFSAYSFVLARDHEYEADRHAARIVGNDAFARALGATYVVGDFLSERFWPATFRRAANCVAPPKDVFAGLAAAIRAGPAPEDAQRWLRDALRQRTEVDDSHPALVERLRALDIPVASLAVGPPPQPDAAEHYLGGALQPLTDRLERAWRKRFAGYWREHNRRMARDRRRLDELAESTGSTAEAAWERARIVLELEGDDAALPFLRDAVAQAPDHAEASFALGRILARRGDETAIGLLERAMVANAFARPAGHDAIARLLEGLGHDDAAAVHRRRAWDARDVLFKAALERRHVGLWDRLVAHDFAPKTVSALQGQLAPLGVTTAWLARKRVAHLPDSPVYALGVVFSGRVGVQELGRIAARVMVPGQVLVITAGPVLRARLRRLPGARIV